MGHPASSYPFSWAIYGWIEGQPYSDDLVNDERQAASDLAQFVVELRRIDTFGAPPGGRKPLRELDARRALAIESSRGVIDSDAATAAWERALVGTGVEGNAGMDPHRPAEAQPAR